MSFGIRRSISKKIAELTKSNSQSTYHHMNNLPTNLQLKGINNDLELHLPVIKTRNFLENYGTGIIKKILNTNYDNRFIKNVSMSTEEESSCVRCGGVDNDHRATFIFKLNKNTFIRETLEEYQHHPNQIEPLPGRERKKIIIEFSSPNIAKPFHVGHLRSTIVGNCLANLERYLGNDIVKLNYLGDWGTQFGFLQIGVDMLKLTDDDIRRNPIQCLYEAYVTANKAGKDDSTVGDRARLAFTQLESDSSSSDRVQWEKYRQYTIDDLKIVYQRLGVEFDEYAWESQYNQKKIQKVLEILQERRLLEDEVDGRRIAQVGDRRVPIIKSDGSTLYLARDIAALLDRYEKYKFNKILYVVDNSQTDHFKALFHIAEKADDRLQNKTEHIKFGRIKGMSTRAGTVVFLKDVLDEAKDIMLQKQIQSPTTKVDIRNLDDEIADILGVSAVIVNDLKQRRQRDYDFNWDKVLQVNGDTGIKLQYTHCRLCSLEENVSVLPAKNPIPDLLSEPEALQLITEIARFSEILFFSLKKKPPTNN